MTDSSKDVQASRPLVLVASANPAIWQRAKSALSSFSVAFAVDLPGTLEIIQRHRPALVVLGSKLLDGDVGSTVGQLCRHYSPGRLLVILSEGDNPPADRRSLLTPEAFLRADEIAAALAERAQARLDAVERPRPLADAKPASRGGGRQRLQLPTDPFDPVYCGMVVGPDPRRNTPLEMALRVALYNVCVLITGESGTGKEVMARWIHRMSARANERFEAVDLPSVPSELFESILFGHEKGSFTGAVAQNRGKFIKASGGTLFLDEISSLKLDLQPKLLRAIQQREVESVGGAATTPVDVRIIAATNVNLAEAVEREQFRGDLYYRLSVVNIDLVPLRERRDDIPFFVDYFGRKYAEAFGLDWETPPAETRRALIRHGWPGNIRELENRVQRAMLLANGDQLQPEDFFGEGDEAACASKGSDAFDFGDCSRSLEEMEALYIARVLNVTEQNQSKAARLLRIDRKTLRSKLQKHGLLEEASSLQSVS